jgi:Ricin-type beta-trefoil lectin domain
MNYKQDTRVGVDKCDGNLQKPGWRQAFRLRNHRDIFIDSSDKDCLDKNNDQLIFYGCKYKQENQYFRYDLDTKQIYCERKRDNNCIDMDPSSKTLFIGACDQNKTTQQWNWGFVNETMLRDWAKFGKPILDPDEKSDFENL